ncbi:MAG: Fic family protein [Bacteroidales bacterium]|jgi:Fic family protein
MTFKAGTYKQQYQYKSYLPSLLANPFEWQSDTVLELLSEASRFIGELNSYADLVPDVNFFIEMHKVKEATTSSRIEGTRTNIDEAVLSENNISVEKRDDWEDVRNYIRALNYSIDRMQVLPLSMRLIKEAHAILLSGVRGKNKLPGEVRRSQNWIGGTDIKSATFVPPAQEDLPDLLTDLEKFWHGETRQLPILIRIAISHYQFETIHPFLDGNGRMGRLLITLQLLQSEFMAKPVLYLSDFFERNRMEYYQALERVRFTDSLDHWLRFFLTGVIQTAQNSKKTFVEIGTLRDSYRERIISLGKREKLATKFLLQLYSAPIVSPREAEKKLGVTAATTNRLISQLEKLGILKEITGYSRNRLYALPEYLDIFRQ